MRGRALSLICLAIAAVCAPAASACTLGKPGTTQRVAIGDTGRSMLLHRQAKARVPVPLLFVLHGSGGDGATILANSKLEATADRHGFLLAAPDGGIAANRGYVWNIPGVPTVTGKVPGPGDPDDVAYLAKTIDWLAAQGCVDRARVYATGLSGGGRMASWLGCVAADRFAAIAPVVGLRAGNPSVVDPRFPDPATCAPARPMPVIAFAGGKDTTNPVEGGGAPYWQYPMARAEGRWADLNGCRRPLPQRTVAGVIQRGYTDCRSRADVAARISPEAGHIWTADNDAMWTFLARHRR